MRAFVFFVLLTSINSSERSFGFSPGPAALSLGSSGVVITDAWSINQNPACIPGLPGTVIAIKQLNRYRIGNWNDASIGLYGRASARTNLGCSFSQEGFSGYKNSNLSLGIGLKNTNRWSTGITIGIESVRTTTHETRKHHNFRTIIGSRIEMNRGQFLALAIDDVQSVFISRSASGFPVTLRTGYWMPVSETFATAVEIAADHLSLGMNAGISYSPKEKISIRIGYSSATKSTCGGLGFDLNKWRIETAVKLHPFLGMSTSVGISYRNDENKK